MDATENSALPTDQGDRSADPTIGSGAFGAWMTDKWGLPAYEYTCNQDLEARALSFHTSGTPYRDHWHLVGNLRWNGLAFNHGGIQIYESDRGPQFLLAGNQSWGLLRIESDGQEPWGDRWPGPDRFRRIFGMGYYRKIVEHNGLRLDHRLVAPPGDVRGFVSEVVLDNCTTFPLEFTVIEPWEPGIRPITAAMVATGRGRKYFGNGWLNQLGGWLLNAGRTVAFRQPDQVQDRLGKAYTYHYLEDEATGALGFQPVCTRARGVHRDDPADFDEFPDPLCLVRCAGPVAEIVRDPGSTRLLCRRHIRLEPGGSTRWMTGFTREKPERFLKQLGAPDRLMSRLANEHRTRRVRLSTASDPWLSRETHWHSYYLRGAATREDFFRTTTLNQGSAYGYLQGMNGAARDLCLAAHPLVYADPPLARAILRYVLGMIQADHKLWYAVTGHGQLSEAVIHHSPSELYLHLLWILTEYLYATRDFEFLMERIPFHPPGQKVDSTVLERIVQACLYQLERIAVGPHGWVRVGSGDWNDPISFMASSRSAFFREGESAFNTAMAIYVYPRVADLLQGQYADLAKRLRLTAERLEKALEASWTGRWYPRAFDGKGKTIGGDRLFLEHHAWILAAAIGDETRRRTLLEEIRATLDAPSPIGAMIVYPPVPVRFGVLKPGWDTNGGIWAAINALLTWGYGRHDPALAYQALLRNTLCRHAEVYPDCWYGIWSGPDAYNAHHAERPGETFYHFATPMTDFPVMNANCHAGPLTAAIRMAGIETGIDGLVIEPRIPATRYELESPLVTLSVTQTELRLDYVPVGRNRYGLRIKVPHDWNPERVSVHAPPGTIDPVRDGPWFIWPKGLYARSEIRLRYEQE